MPTRIELYRQLPDVVSDYIFDGEKEAAVRKQLAPYDLSAEQLTAVIVLAEDLLLGLINFGGFVPKIEEITGFDTGKARMFARDLIGYRLLPLESFIDGIQDFVKELGGELAQYPRFRVEKPIMSTMHFVESILKEADLTFDDESLQNRLEFLLSAYLRGTHTKEHTEQTFARSMKVGGLGLSPEVAAHLVEIIDNQRTKVLLSEIDDLPKEHTKVSFVDEEEEGGEEIEKTEDTQEDQKAQMVQKVQMDQGNQEVQRDQGVLEAENVETDRDVSKAADTKPTVKPPKQPTQEKKPVERKPIQNKEQLIKTKQDQEISDPPVSPLRKGGDTKTRVISTDPAAVGGSKKRAVPANKEQKRQMAVASVNAKPKQKRAPKKSKMQAMATEDRLVKEAIEAAKQKLETAMNTDDDKVREEVSAILKKLNISYPSSDMQQRLRRFIRSGLTRVRPLEALKLQLTASVKKGGMGLSEEVAQNAINLISSHHSPKEKQSASKKKPIQQKATPKKPVFNKELDDRFKNLTGKEPLRIEKPQQVVPTLSKESIPPHTEEHKRPPVTDIKFEPTLTGPVEEFARMTLVDFRRLSREPDQAIMKLEDKIELLQEESYDTWVKGVRAWHASPLYSQYVGAMKAKLSGGGVKSEKDALTQEEITVLTRFNQKLRF